MVEKQIEEDKARQLAIMNLAVESGNACGAKDDMRKTYEECNHIPQETRALIDTFLKEGSNKDYEMRATMILANVSVFILKPSKHYLNITMRNVVKVFRKDTVPGSGSGSGSG
ncbi:reverse transcriptase zinc-binding domain-containing protein [Tanacetum coccineum]